jgi:hypothetical protein
MCQSRCWLRAKGGAHHVERYPRCGGPGKVRFPGRGVRSPWARESTGAVARDKFPVFFAQLPSATVVMEACGSAHFWGRRIEELGHRVVLLPAQYVRPYVLRNKTDRTDTGGMLEAYRNDDIRPVPIKSVPQQEIRDLGRAHPQCGAATGGAGPADPRRAASAHDPRHRSPHRHRASGLCGRCPALSLRAPPGQLSRPHPARVLQWNEASAGAGLEAGRCLPAHAPHPWGSLSALPRQEDEAARISFTHHNAARANRSDGETGRTGTGKVDNNAGPRGHCQRLASRCADSIMARGRKRPRREAADTSAVDLPPALPSPSIVECHGATRASRPCGRLRRCAPRSLDPLYAP